MYQRFRWDVRPAALSHNVISGKTYRFTALTPQLLRLEYSPDGIFEDRASQMAFYRDFAPCDFTHGVHDGIVTLETEHLLLTYTENAPFSQDSLCVKLKSEPATTWRFGDTFETLGGTAETLDTVDGPAARLCAGQLVEPLLCLHPAGVSGLDGPLPHGRYPLLRWRGGHGPALHPNSGSIESGRLKSAGLRRFGSPVVNPLLEQLTLTEDPYMDQVYFTTV